MKKLPILISVIVVAALSWVFSPLLMTGAKAQSIVSARVPAQVAEIWALYNNTVGISSSAFTVSSAAGRGITGYQFTNLASSAEYVHFYNTASAPVVGTTPTILTVAVPATSTVTYITNGDVVIFSHGIGFSVTKGYADTNTTPATSGDVIGFITYE